MSPFSREHTPHAGEAELAVVLPSASVAEADTLAAARDLLRADTDMTALVADWASRHETVGRIAAALPGLRVLRQDPWECLVSFICSSNNNIARIMQMLAKLRRAYGTSLGEAGGVEFFAFPTVEALADASEAALRGLGLGYRAKFVIGTARAVRDNGGVGWLLGLRERPSAEVTTSLLSLLGVGPKVADCVALFSLDQHAAIPVDTHVWAIACRDMDPSLKDAKSLTPAVYARVTKLFSDLYGPYSGWAHCALFSAELPAFRRLLPEDMQRSIEEFAKAEREENKTKREAARARKRAREEAAKAKTEEATPEAAEEDAAEAKPEAAQEEAAEAEPLPPPSKRVARAAAE